MATPAIRLDFAKLINNELQLFLASCRELGEPLIGLADLVHQAFKFEQVYIEQGLDTLQSQRGKLANLLDDLSRSIREIDDFRNRNRHNQEFFNHLAAVAESIVALSWVTMERTPAQFVRDLKEAGDYFGNRVLAAYKSNPAHVNWWNRWVAVIKALESYVTKHHLTGFAYASQAPPPAFGVPAAPPLPPPEPFPCVAGGDAMRNALLNQLNQGVGIVGMLRPVRPQATAPVAEQAPVPVAERAPAPTGARARAPVAAQVQPPRLLLDGRKWRVENQLNATGLTVSANEMSESVAIYRCENSEIDVTNKINGATIDTCRRGTVVFRDVISTVELIRCQRMTIQCIGHVPSINLDTCDSIQIFLTENSRDTEIITSKTTSLNICLLSPDGDYVELPVPEQIRTTIVRENLHSSVVQQI